MDEIEKLAVTQLAFPIIKDFLVPKIKSTYKKYFEKEKEEDYQDNFETYLSNRYYKFSIIDTLAFPNKQTLFETLYEPLSIRSEQREQVIEVKIDCYPKRLIEDNYRIIIADTAGMGKSTIIKKLRRNNYLVYFFMYKIFYVDNIIS